MKLWTALKLLFTAPTFPGDEEKTLRAKVLHALLINLSAVFLLALTLGIPFIFKEKIVTGSALLVMLLLCLAALIISCKGHVQMASVMLLSGMWGLTTALVFISGGIHSLDILLYLSGVVIAGLVLGINGSSTYGILSLVVLLLMAILELRGGQFPKLFFFPPLAIWIIVFIGIGCILLPLNITLKSLTESLDRAKRVIEERSKAEEAARQRAGEMSLLYEFGMAIATGKNLYDLLSHLQEQISRLLPSDAFFVALYDEDTDTISFPYFIVKKGAIKVESRKLSNDPGLTGAVIRAQETLYIPDIMTPQANEKYHPRHNDDLDSRTFLGVPLIAEEKVIGIISIQLEAIDAYRTDQIRLFEALATQASAAIQRTNLIEQLQQELSERKNIEAEIRYEQEMAAERRKLLERMIELGKQIAQITDLRECLRKAHYCIQKEIGFDRVGLFLYDAKENSVLGAFGTDLDGEIEDTSWFVQNVDEFDAWKQALKEPSGVTIQNDYQEKHHFGQESEMHGVKQHVTVSAWAGEKPIALITVDNVISGKPIRDEEIEALRLFAGYVGLTIRNARLNTDLERRVQERTAQLELAMSELESFSYAVGHDLRAPLRGMRGFSQIIMDESGDKLDEMSKTNLERIILAAQNMGELIDALLEFSRLMRTPLRRTKVNLSRIAEYTITLLVSEFLARKVQVEIAPAMIVDADERLIEIVIKNLIENAWKYTSKTENAKIIFGEEEQDGKRIFFVRDNGAGFDMAYSKKLFGAFQRLHRVDEFPGHGAGLATVQRIIHRHGGKIWGFGEVNKGATFYFTLD